MNFGEAIAALKAGKSVCRTGWNGKGMHLYLEDHLSHVVGGGIYAGQQRKYAPCLCIYTAQDVHQPGWLANQADMLADDWAIAVHA